MRSENWERERGVRFGSESWEREWGERDGVRVSGEREVTVRSKSRESEGSARVGSESWEMGRDEVRVGVRGKGVRLVYKWEE